MNENGKHNDTQAVNTLRRASNQVGVRNYNERVILQLIREHGAITKADATRATGLSANATSVIFRSLENENLLKKGEPIRGKIGQPSIPISLNADAAYFMGLKLGRRSADMVLMNFSGQIAASESVLYEFPLPEQCIEFTKAAIRNLLKKTRVPRSKVVGLGVAMPFELWSWTEDFGAPNEQMQIWKSYDLKAELSKKVKIDVHIINDGTAACSAELTYSGTKNHDDFMYLYIGTFIGGGIVLNGSVFSGKSGNAGGFGPMPIPNKNGGADRLVDHASLVVLEKMIATAGGDPKSIYRNGEGWVSYSEQVSEWVDMTARGLAHAIVASLSVIDFEIVVIDGTLPPNIKDKIIECTSKETGLLDLQGIAKPEIKAGHFGDLARAVGAASVVMNNIYSIDQNTLLRG